MAVRRGRMAAAAAVVGTVSAAALLAGCAGDGAAADGVPAGAGAADPVRQAAEVMARSGSSTVTTSMEMASGGTRVVIRGTGGFDYGREVGRLRLTLPRDAAGAEEHAPVIELMTSGALYMKNRGEGVPADKWVRVDTTRLSDGNLVTGGATDPMAALELLRGAREVRLVGTETVAGVRVRHFRGMTDIARAAHAASPGGRGALTAAARGFTVTEVPFDVYLDDTGRVRKVVHRFTFSNGSGAGQGAPRSVVVVSTTTFDGFGTPVQVVLPKQADIYDGKIVSSGGP